MPPDAATLPLPSTIREALRQIASELADVPRDCCVDRAELLLWLRRMARRVDGVRGMRVSSGRPASISIQRTIVRPPTSPATTARAAAEALFTKTNPTAARG